MSLAAHELRTPLSVVAGYLRMLLREQGGPVSDKQRKMLEEAERSCARMAVLVSEMSDLGKLESGQLELERRPIDLAALVAELASRMHEGGDRGVRLEVRGTDRPLRVIGDRSRLEAAIGALLYATLRERGEPGVIVAECSATDGPERSAIIAISDETSVRRLAQAAAAGAPFDEWMRGGLGLALPVARRIVEAHGGTLWSEHGEGPRTGSALRIPLNENQV
jgi:two-component system, cell cycle sensor histidine kinase PleC